MHNEKQSDEDIFVSVDVEAEKVMNYVAKICCLKKGGGVKQTKWSSEAQIMILCVGVCILSM